MHDFYFWPTFWTIAVVLGVMLVTCGFLIYVERKVAAYVQDRIGPNRVGPAGLFQSVADGLKFLLKEDVVPGHVDKPLFLAAPAIALTTALLAFSVVPFGGPAMPYPEPPPHPAATATEAELRQYEQAVAEYRRRQDEYARQYRFAIAPGLDIGIVFIFAVTSLTVYAIILGGWSANNKYSFIGGL